MLRVKRNNPSFDQDTNNLKMLIAKKFGYNQSAINALTQLLLGKFDKIQPNNNLINVKVETFSGAIICNLSVKKSTPIIKIKE